MRKELNILLVRKCENNIRPSQTPRTVKLTMWIIKMTILTIENKFIGHNNDFRNYCLLETTLQPFLYKLER